MWRVRGMIALVSLSAGCVLLPPPPPQSPRLYIDNARITNPIQAAIPVGTPVVNADRTLRAWGFKPPPICAAPGWPRPPYVHTQRVGNTTIRTEVRVTGSDRVEKIDILPGYAWDLPDDEAGEQVPPEAVPRFGTTL